jgi:hypothetical protein
MPYNGSGGAHALDNGLTLPFRLRTGLGGRGKYGRFFPPGLGDALVDATDPNQISAGALTAANTAATAFLAALNNNDLIAGAGDVYDLVVASFVHNHITLPHVSVTPVTEISVRERWLCFQRRRAPGHNRHH